MGIVPNIRADHLNDLVRRAQTGDSTAFETLVRQYQRRVRAWIAVHCPPGGDADEVAQQTFVAVFTRLAEFQEGTNFEAWLFAIARYKLLTEITRLRRQTDYHARYVFDWLARELARRAEEPEDGTANRLAHLGGCLDQLKSLDREMLTFRYRDQLPLEELAVRTGRSVGAVKKWLWTLRQRLRDCIDLKLAAEGRA